jgi:hypothetical protein
VATKIAASTSTASGASAAWLSATTALTQAELALIGDAEKAKEVFLQHDPRAGDIWPNDMKKLRMERLERMEEAKTLGEDIERIKEAKEKVQAALEALKIKLREAEAAAAVDPGGAAQNTAATIRGLLAAEEPKLVQLLQEKQQRYELDYSRLAELKRELAHLKHGEEKLSAAIQSEFATWRKAVEERYPEIVRNGANDQADVVPDMGGAATGMVSVDSAAPSCRSSPSGPPPQLPRSSPSHSSRGAQASMTLASGCGEALSRTNTASSVNGPPKALAKAEALLVSLRQRLEEARERGDLDRQRMLEQLLSVEEPKLARMRAESV